MTGSHTKSRQHRGPAKDYIDILNNRVIELESILRATLPMMADVDLSTALENTTSVEGQKLTQRKVDADYILAYPLSSVQQVRYWQQAVQVRDGSEEQDGSRKSETPLRDGNPSATSIAIFCVQSNTRR